MRMIYDCAPFVNNKNKNLLSLIIYACSLPVANIMEMNI